jgi:Peptidase family M28
MKTRFLFIFLLTINVGYGQKFNPQVGQAVNSISNGVSYLRTFEAFGVKELGTAAIDSTRDWLVSTYRAIGYDSISLDSFISGGGERQNIIVKKQGILNDYIIICSHYDTKSGPGVNDNGTGVSATLQAAEILKDMVTTRTVYFVHFSAEEIGFIGSYHFVNEEIGSINGNLYAVINLDQLGGTLGGSGNDKIYCERDEISPPKGNNALSWLITDTLVNLCKLYTALTPELSQVFSSDYIPFQEKGFVVSGLYQFSNFPYRHTKTDSLYRIDTTSFLEASKLAVAATIHFAQVPKFISAPKLNEKVNTVYNEGGDLIINLLKAPDYKSNVSVFDGMGRVIMKRSISNRLSHISVSHFLPGIYHVQVEINSTTVLVKSIAITPDTR